MQDLDGSIIHRGVPIAGAMRACLRLQLPNVPTTGPVVDIMRALGSSRAVMRAFYGQASQTDRPLEEWEAHVLDIGAV